MHADLAYRLLVKRCMQPGHALAKLSWGVLSNQILSPGWALHLCDASYGIYSVCSCKWLPKWNIVYVLHPVCKPKLSGLQAQLMAGSRNLLAADL